MSEFLGNFALPETGGSASVAIGILIDPPRSNMATGFDNPATPLPQALLQQPCDGIITLTKAVITCTAAQLVSALSPLNWTTLAADGAATTAGNASITLSADPGLYSVSYRGGRQPQPPNAFSTANNAIAAGDWIGFQMADGTWVADLVTAVAGSSTILVGLTSALGTGGVKQGSLVYFFGVPADINPATGRKRPQTTFPASSARDTSWNSTDGIAFTLFNGDPMLLLAGNTDNATKINYATGRYAL